MQGIGKMLYSLNSDNEPQFYKKKFAKVFTGFDFWRSGVTGGTVSRGVTRGPGVLCPEVQCPGVRCPGVRCPGVR